VWLAGSAGWSSGGPGSSMLGLGWNGTVLVPLTPRHPGARRDLTLGRAWAGVDADLLGRLAGSAAGGPGSGLGVDDARPGTEWDRPRSVHASSSDVSRDLARGARAWSVGEADVGADLLGRPVGRPRLSGGLGSGPDDNPEVSSRRTPGSLHLRSCSAARGPGSGPGTTILMCRPGERRDPCTLPTTLLSCSIRAARLSGGPGSGPGTTMLGLGRNGTAPVPFTRRVRVPGVGRWHGRGRGSVGTAGRFGWSDVRGPGSGPGTTRWWVLPPLVIPA
jgi:hypothetical protein